MTEIVDTPRKLSKLVETLSKEKRFAFDCESIPGRGPLNQEMLVCSIATSMECSWVIPCGIYEFKEQEGGGLRASAVANALKPVMENRDIVKIGHNIKFDAHVFACYGVAVRNKWDTMIAGWLLDENLLKTLKVRAAELGMFLREFKEAFKQPVKEFLEYADQDAVATIGLYNLYKKRLKAQNLYEVFKNQEMPVMEAVYRMERRGVTIDEPFLKVAEKAAKKEIEKVESEIYKGVGEAFNIGSPKQLAKVLYGKLRLACKEYTPKGEPSTNVTALEGLQGKHPVVDHLLRYRKLSKLLTTYIGEEGLRRFIYKGKIHCNFNTVGTVTGRASSSEPNLQNISRSEDEDPSPYFHVRRAFLPGKNKVFVCADYSQIELRVLAHFSNDKNMIRAYSNNLDIHQQTADAMGLEGPKARQIGKTVNFACIAEGQLVLTDSGLIPIEQVRCCNRVWDGVEWVSHEGVIFKGVRHVIQYQGIAATEDHKVWTRDGRKISLWNAALEHATLARSGNAAKEVQVEDVTDRFNNFAERGKLPLCGCQMQSLSKGKDILCGQSSVWKDIRLQVSKISKIFRSACAFFREPLRSHDSEMLQRYTCFQPSLQGAGNQSIVQVEGTFYSLGAEEIPEYGYSPSRFRQDRQRWSLFSGKSSASDSLCKLEKPVKVYDILNAGPRHRFTCSNVLVSNCIYGAGPTKIGFLCGVSMDEGREFLSKFFEYYHGVSALKNDLIELADRQKYILLLTGRRRRVLGLDSADKMLRSMAERQLLNSLVQGSSADIFKLAMIKINRDARLKEIGYRMLLQVHDEIVGEVPAGKEKLAVKYVKEDMENCLGFKLRVPLIADVSAGSNWENAKG